jgi:hypothetical protein
MRVVANKRPSGDTCFARAKKAACMGFHCFETMKHAFLPFAPEQDPAYRFSNLKHQKIIDGRIP